MPFWLAAAQLAGSVLVLVLQILSFLCRYVGLSAAPQVMSVLSSPSYLLFLVFTQHASQQSRASPASLVPRRLQCRQVAHGSGHSRVCIALVSLLSSRLLFAQHLGECTVSHWSCSFSCSLSLCARIRLRKTGQSKRESRPQVLLKGQPLASLAKNPDNLSGSLVRKSS